MGILKKTVCSYRVFHRGEVYDRPAGSNEDIIFRLLR